MVVGRERLKCQREKELAIALSGGGGASSSTSADPNAISAVVEGQLRAHYNVKKQAAQATGSGNPHMQIMGKYSDLVFRETLKQFWWPKVNFQDSQYYDRPLKSSSTAGNQSLASNINLDEYSIPKGQAKGSEQHHTLDHEFHGMYGKGKRVLEEPGHGAANFDFDTLYVL